MCDVCADFLQLLESYETRITANDAKHSILLKSEIEIAFGYIQAWPTRQCMCLYRDIKNFERFNLVVQSMVCLSVHHLKHMNNLVEDYRRITLNAAQAAAQVQAHLLAQSTASSPSSSEKDVVAGEDAEQICVEEIDSEDAEANKENNKQVVEKVNKQNDTIEKELETKQEEKQMSKIRVEEISENKAVSPPPLPPPRPKNDLTAQIVKPAAQHTEEHWILPEVEKLFLLVSKVFLLNFPLYIAFKHSTQARLDDISAEEAQHLSIFCDLHDNEIPVYLLRNVSLFCNSGGFAAMTMCFQMSDLPVSTAHAITAVVSNVKLWLNYSCVVQLFMPLRSRVLQYMCKMSDQNLRTAATRAMADFVWSSVREPMDSSLTFDVEGLALKWTSIRSQNWVMHERSAI